MNDIPLGPVDTITRASLPQGKVVVIILHVASNVFDDMNTWRELHVLSIGNALGFKNHQSAKRSVIGIKLKVLPFPYKALTSFVNGLTIGVCLT